MSYVFCKKNFKMSKLCLKVKVTTSSSSSSKEEQVDWKFNSFDRGKWNLLRKKGLRGLGL